MLNDTTNTATCTDIEPLDVILTSETIPPDARLTKKPNIDTNIIELLELAHQKLAAEAPAPSEYLQKVCSNYDEPPTGTGDFSEDELSYFEPSTNWQQELNAHINDFNSQFAVVLNGTKALVMKTNYDDERGGRKQRIYLTFQALNGLYSNQKIKVGEKIVKDEQVDIVKSKSQAWLDNPQRAQYIDGIIFKPSSYANGIEKKPVIHGNKLNLWEGYSIKPKQGEQGALDRIHYHISHIVCNDDPSCVEYLLNWVARCLQYPEKTGQVAVALKGEKGCGKGTLGNFIKAIFGQHGLQVTNPKHLTGSFNAHLADCCFLFADEVFFAGDKVVENQMKGLITEPTLMVESKGIDAVEMTNRLKIFMASNNEWIAPATKDERRYFVLDVSSREIGNTEYFKQLHRDINNPEIQAAFLHEMLHRDIENFNVGKIPDTKALQHQRAQSLDSFGQYWMDVLDRGVIYQSQHNNYELHNWINKPATDLIRAGYEQWRDKNKIGQFGIVSGVMIGRHLKNWYGEKAKESTPACIGESTKGELLKSNSRPYCYNIGSRIEAITDFCIAEKLDPDKLLKNCE